jgi:hypothetical protein
MGIIKICSNNSLELVIINDHYDGHYLLEPFAILVDSYLSNLNKTARKSLWSTIQRGFNRSGFIDKTIKTTLLKSHELTLLYQRY